MTLLILGLILWIVPHWLKRLAPDLRASMGARGRGVISILLFIGLGLMIYGYRQAEVVNIWYPPAFLVHFNNLLMVVAVAVFAMAHTKGRLRGKMRHPMLVSVKIWAIAHLLVNGDLASIILFGGMLVWAVVSVILINRAEDWTRPEPGDKGRDWLFAVITVVTFARIIGVHIALGVHPFPG
jgi:uncharacterized membrane protein